jgi:RNA polymerase sigma-70 factor (ECF subfamily)
LSSTDDRLRVLRGFKILDKMKIEHRIIFIMRYIDGEELTEVASAMGCSLATIKRRLNKARDVFLKHALKDPFLSPLVKGRSCDE